MSKNVFVINKEYQKSTKLVRFKRPTEVVQMASYLLKECSAFPKLKRLLALLEQHDAATYVHSSTVAILSLRIGMEFGYNSQMSSWLLLASLMHDIGKLMLDKELLTKTDALIPQEKTLLNLHPQWGIELLKSSNIPEGVMQGILQHHERWNGTGFPQKRKGHEIHPFAQIIAVADTFDALTTARPYFPTLSAQDAIELIRNRSDVNFSPAVVSAFLTAMAKNSLQRK